MRRKQHALVRRTFTATAAVSLAVGVLACLLWVHSYFRTNSVRYTGHASRSWLTVDRGVIEFEFTDGDPGDRGFAWNDYNRAASYGRGELDMFGNAAWARFGFGTWTEGCADGGHFLSPLPDRVVFFPFWLIVLAAGIAPAMWFIRTRNERRRVRLNLCAVCGYDLRATPERCPECGNRVISGETPVA